jgi:hypothetical protein
MRRVMVRRPEETERALAVLQPKAWPQKNLCVSE